VVVLHPIDLESEEGKDSFSGQGEEGKEKKKKMGESLVGE